VDAQVDSELLVREDSRDKVVDSRKLKGRVLFEVENSLLRNLDLIVDSVEDSTVEEQGELLGKIEDLDSVDSKEPLLSKWRGKVRSEVGNSLLLLLRLLGGLSQVLVAILRGQMEKRLGREVVVYPLPLPEVKGDLSVLDSVLDVVDLEVLSVCLLISLNFPPKNVES